MYNFWARKKECSSVFQIQSMDMWKNTPLNNWDYLFCPIQSPNCKDSCFVLNPFKTRQELLQSHLNRWARDLMLESQLHSEAMTCAQSSGFQIGVAIMHFWDSMSPLISFHSWEIWNGLEEDQTAVWISCHGCCTNHMRLVKKVSSYSPCPQETLKKHLRSMLYIVKLPFKYPISCIIANLELKFSIYCQYVANGKKSKVNEIINWEK